jgi:hypothetical protein
MHTTTPSVVGSTSWSTSLPTHPGSDGHRIEVELTCRPMTFTRRLLVALPPLVAPRTLKKSFAGSLRAK